jgi:hypothetical protein
MSMGKGAKIAIGCLVALLVVCVIAAVVVFVAGRAGWNMFGGFAKDAAAIQKLDQTYAFSEPADGVVTEARLQAYIAACAKVKPAIEKLQEFTKSKQGGSPGSWTDAKDAVKFTAAIITAMRQGLDEQKMSPKEFHFVGNAMKTASFGASETPGGQPLDASQRQAKEMMLKNMEGLLANPGLPQEQRDEIQGQIEQIRQELEQAPSTDPNVVLYLKYKDQLKQVDLQGLEGVAFQQSPEKS